MQRSDQPGIIGVEADRQQIDLEVFRLQHDLGTRDRKLPHPALAKTATDHDALGLGPRLGLEEAPGDISEFLANSSIALCTMAEASTSSPISISSSTFLLILSDGSSPKGSSPVLRSGLRQRSKIS